MVQFELIEFSKIKCRLPEDCSARQRIECKDGGLEKEFVIVYRGDTRLSEIDLGHRAAGIEGEGAGALRIVLVLVEGNLTVANWIGNAEASGATDLVVLGNLKVRNALLSGQQVYVAGDMMVEELLWGDHGHGNLIVGGDIFVPRLIDTEGYHFAIGGQRHIGRHLSEADLGTGESHLRHDVAPSELIEAGRPPDVACEEVSLLRQTMLKKLQAGKSIVRIEGGAERPSRPSLFVDRRVTIDNVLLVADPARMIPNSQVPAEPFFNFWAGDIFCRASMTSAARGISAVRRIYLQSDSHILLVSATWRETPPSALCQPISPAPAGAWTLTMVGKSPVEDGGEGWRDLDPEAGSRWDRFLPREYQELLNSGWNALLDGASTYDHARTLIGPEEMRSLLALPVVEPYVDFGTDDYCGFSAGGLGFAFRQDCSHGGEPRPAQLRIDFESIDVDRGKRAERYFFEIRRHIDGTECVFIGYNDDPRGDLAWTPLSFLGGVRLRAAVLAFRAGCRRLDVANAALVEDGIPPNRDDDFAIKRWRERGYLRSSSFGGLRGSRVLSGLSRRLRRVRSE